MKHLVVVRHAKSSWNHPELDDFDRPLNARGERDAPAMAQRLAERGPTPDAVVSSAAVRALATARVFAEALELGPECLRVDPRLYLASVESWIAALRESDEAWERVLTVGHNPGATMLVQALARAGVTDLPTCAVAEIELDIDSWGELAPGRGRLVVLDTPKGGPSQ